MKPRSTAENVFDLLRNDIVLGVLKPRQPLRESEIAARLGISRTPIREALLRLEGLGLVDIFPQSGTRVSPIRLHKVRAAQLIREAVEVMVVRHLGTAITVEQLDGLSHLIEDQELAARRNDLPRLFDLDEQFHRTLFECVGLSAVADELQDLKSHLNRLRYVSVTWPRGADKITAEHRQIVAALRGGDTEAAAQAMTGHLRAVLPAIERIARDPDIAE